MQTLIVSVITALSFKNRSSQLMLAINESSYSSCCFETGWFWKVAEYPSWSSSVMSPTSCLYTMMTSLASWRSSTLYLKDEFPARTWNMLIKASTWRLLKYAFFRASWQLFRLSVSKYPSAFWATACRPWCLRRQQMSYSLTVLLQKDLHYCTVLCGTRAWIAIQSILLVLYSLAALMMQRVSSTVHCLQIYIVHIASKSTL
ncbi:Hypothetical_protein [Hexamita inflata]|uniref:Hypothetical_protein n=1 Tax=Hexamita inflata TaxID=28002 RepID=A0AA86NE42_9EUKA|nr:Hypothetical protein HINF_LOCUS5772 [Hexamita inflata]